MISDVVGEKESAKSMMTNAVFGLLLALGSFAILNTINPTILSLNFIGGGSETGGEAPIPEGNNGNDDSSLECTGTVEELPPGFIYTGGNKVKPSLKTKLITLKSSLDSSALAGWRVTEACPRTRAHANQCHYNGTCIDASFSSPIGSSETGSVFAQRVLLFITKANDAGLRAVFETQSQSQRDYLVNTGGVPAGNTLVWQNITAPHFSVYCDSCQ